VSAVLCIIHVLAFYAVHCSGMHHVARRCWYANQPWCMHRALAAAVTAAPLLGSVRPAAADDQQGVASSRMSYSRFLEYLDMGRVKKVISHVDSMLTMHDAEQLLQGLFFYRVCNAAVQ
jgi:hypothetical protein